MGRFIQKLQYVKTEDVLSLFTMLAAYPYAIVLKKKRPHLWLFCEDRNEARDNGFWLYRHTCHNHPETDAVYAIEPKSPDLEKVKKIGGEVIPWGGLRHWAYYLAAEKNISSQKDGKPNAALCYLLEVYGIRKNKRAFLQHGITHNDTQFLYYKNTKMSLFVCGARKEYDYIRKFFGYPEGAVQFLGFARYDGLYDYKVKHDQVLIMPSWRKSIATPARFQKHMDTEEEFVKTEYYRAWKGFLNDKEFRNMIHANDLKVIFYPHRCMQRFLSFFKPDDPSIIMADPEKYDVQELLKESAILITDYSSVAMDFAYMKKPLLYYQFDKETFVNEQYGRGYFSYERDGFGPVEYEIGGLKQALRNYIENGFNMEEKYRGRRDDFFELNDCNNCERNYQAVLEM